MKACLLSVSVFLLAQTSYALTLLKPGLNGKAAEDRFASDLPSEQAAPVSFSELKSSNGDNGLETGHFLSYRHDEKDVINVEFASEEVKGPGKELEPSGLRHKRAAQRNRDSYDVNRRRTPGGQRCKTCPLSTSRPKHAPPTEKTTTERSSPQTTTRDPSRMGSKKRPVSRPPSIEGPASPTSTQTPLCCLI